MKTKLMGLMIAAGGALFTQQIFAQQYPPQYSGPQGGDPNYQNYPQQGGYDQQGAYPQQGQYDQQGAYPQQGGYPAQAYPQQYPQEAVAMQPPMPGPGYIWIDGYYDASGVFVPGFWDLPPYAGAFWVGPRFFGGRWNAGYWGGPRGVIVGGYRGGFRGPAAGFRGGFRGPAVGFRAGANEGFRSGFRAGEVHQAPRNEFRGGGQAFHGNAAPAFHGGGGQAFHGGGQAGHGASGGHGRR